MDLSGDSLVLKCHRSSIHPCGAEAAIHLQAMSLESCSAFNAPSRVSVSAGDGLSVNVLDRMVVLSISWAGMTFNGERRPTWCALKVTSRSITLHELVRTVPVVDTLIPGIGPRMHEVNGNVPVLVHVRAFFLTLLSVLGMVITSSIWVRSSRPSSIRGA